MPKNRLKLNWDLPTSEERLDFLNSYLPSLHFTPSPHELETLSDYVLSRDSGKSSYLSTPPVKTDSLDALVESPTFSETAIRPLQSVPYKIPKASLDRSKVSPRLAEVLSPLWHQIDLTALTLTYYDQNTGRRTTPINPTLYPTLSPTDRSNAALHALSLSNLSYWRLRRDLRAMYQEQYTIKDAVLGDLFQTAPTPHQWEIDFSLSILPLPIDLDDSSLFSLIFRTDRLPIPSDFSPSQLKTISNLLWQSQPSPSLDLRDPFVLSQLISLYHSFDTSSPLRAALTSYFSLIPLEPWQRAFLDLKLANATNSQIQDTLSSQFSRPYNINYISTIYHHQILPAIIQTISLHFATIQNIFFPENFKTCKDCGQTLLLTADLWVHKKKSSDGFDCRCKSCTKKLRERRAKEAN